MNKFSCVTITAGRVPHLEAAIACYLDQQCDWPRELVVLNTCTQQELSMDRSELFNVRIINLSTRPSSLGDARNHAVNLASGSHIVVWDDDDEYAPRYLHSFATGFNISPVNEWVWINKQFYSVGGKVMKLVQGSCNTLAFSKSAWEKVGGYNTALSVGEDRELMGKITMTIPGVRLEVPDAEVGFIYAWGQGVYHVSGEGMDRPGRATAWQRAGNDLERRIRGGSVKTGKVMLTPKIKVKPEEKIKRFFASKEYQKSAQPGSTLKTSKVRLFHAVERHAEHADARKEQARQSWEVLYTQGVVACHYWNYERDATSIGDRRKLPFLKDVLRFAMSKCDNDDIVFLTNDDTVLHPALGDLLVKHVTEFGPCCSQRCEFRGNVPKLSEQPERIASLGRVHMGRDLFAARKVWWAEHWNYIPDYLLAASDWDLGMACLFRKHHGILSTRRNLEATTHPAELPRGFVLHRFHAPAWAAASNIHAAPSQVWNRKLFKQWCETNLPEVKFGPNNMI